MDWIERHSHLGIKRSFAAQAILRMFNFWLLFVIWFFTGGLFLCLWVTFAFYQALSTELHRKSLLH